LTIGVKGSEAGMTRQKVWSAPTVVTASQRRAKKVSSNERVIEVYLEDEENADGPW